MRRKCEKGQEKTKESNERRCEMGKEKETETK